MWSAWEVLATFISTYEEWCRGEICQNNTATSPSCRQGVPSYDTTGCLDAETSRQHSSHMDTAILEAVASYEVGFSLMPLPKKSEKVEPKASAPSSTYGGWQDGRRNTQQPYQKGQGWQRKRERKESCWHGSKGASRQEVVLWFQFGTMLKGSKWRWMWLWIPLVHAARLSCTWPWVWAPVKGQRGQQAHLTIWSNSKSCSQRCLFSRLLGYRSFCWKLQGDGMPAPIELKHFWRRPSTEQKRLRTGGGCRPVRTWRCWVAVVMAAKRTSSCSIFSAALWISVQRRDRYRWSENVLVLERGNHGPRPLRDDNHPNGPPNLSDTDIFSVQRRMASARSFNMFPSMLHIGLIN